MQVQRKCCWPVSPLPFTHTPMYLDPSLHTFPNAGYKKNQYFTEQLRLLNLDVSLHPHSKRVLSGEVLAFSFNRYFLRGFPSAIYPIVSPMTLIISTPIASQSRSLPLSFSSKHYIITMPLSGSLIHNLVGPENFLVRKLSKNCPRT